MAYLPNDAPLISFVFTPLIPLSSGSGRIILTVSLRCSAKYSLRFSARFSRLSDKVLVQDTYLLPNVQELPKLCGLLYHVYMHIQHIESLEAIHKALETVDVHHRQMFLLHTQGFGQSSTALDFTPGTSHHLSLIYASEQATDPLYRVLLRI